MNHNNTTNVKQSLLKSGIVHPSAALQEAVAEDSNHLAEWLWYADQMESAAERRYCLQRALYINPTNRVALDGLRDLNKQQTPRNENAVAPFAWLSRVWSR